MFRHTVVYVFFLRRVAFPRHGLFTSACLPSQVLFVVVVWFLLVRSCLACLFYALAVGWMLACGLSGSGCRCKGGPSIVFNEGVRSSFVILVARVGEKVTAAIIAIVMNIFGLTLSRCLTGLTAKPGSIKMLECLQLKELHHLPWARLPI